ncbi:helix-turn-helix domain-containing protein [Bradyrhizobium sp. USDA 313]|uniref:helix-turn-helix domain-containing protein n=1 Tax=Bradyrhizobium sp. USDA 313 TaxID=3156307 RepID=UPI00351120C6
MAVPLYLTLDEVIDRYRNQISQGTLRNWRSKRIGPSFIKIGKAVLYPSDELDRWDRSNVVLCHRTKDLPFDDDAASDGRCMSG